MSLKVGSLVFATNQGLGILAKDFYDHGIVTHPCILKHGSRTDHRGWYPPDTPFVDLRATRRAGGVATTLYDYVKTLDVLLGFETFFDWNLVEHCRAHGVKTVLMPMYECTPQPLPAVPDAILTPSLLDQRYYPQGTHLPVPVPDWVAWRPRGTVRTYVHNAGNGGLLGRNGTRTLLDALYHSAAPYRLILHTQQPLDGLPRDSRLEVRVGDFSPEKRYAEGEAFVFPEKFNGLSLPLQEAFASGYLVLATDRFPNTAYLPHTPLLPVHQTHPVRAAGHCPVFDCAEVHPVDLAQSLDFWFGRDVTLHSEQGREWGAAHRWDVLKPRYHEFLNHL